MADIRIRENTNKPYQVRFIDRTKSSGYGYRSFLRARDAKAFKAEKDLEEDRGAPAAASLSVPDAITRWLVICETEGTDGNDPVTDYTLSLYRYHASFMKAYSWPCDLSGLTTPDVVDFRSWLIEACPSRYVARKTLAYFKTVLSEQVLRGVIPVNVAAGIVIKEKTR